MNNSDMIGVAQNEEAQKVNIKPVYLEALTLVERLHRRLLDVIKDEFDRQGRSDLNAVQALLLYNLGDSELTAGELRTRGYYLGSNVSYNLKKLVDMGYIHHQRSRTDRRSVRVSLTEKGKEIERFRLIDVCSTHRKTPIAIQNLFASQNEFSKEPSEID